MEAVHWTPLSATKRPLDWIGSELSPVLLIDAIPNSIEIIVLTIVWFAGGVAGGFFLYRVRNKKDLGLFEAREKALGNREKELTRIRSIMKAQQPTDNSDTLEATITMLREEIEQKSLDISIAKEDYDLETRILRDEIESLKSGEGAAAGFAYEIEDVAFSTEPSEIEESIEPEKESSESESPETRSSENEESVTDWATNIISYLFGDFDSSADQEPVNSADEEPTTQKAESVTDQKGSELPVETSDVTIPEFPQFKSLTDLFPLLILDEDDSDVLDSDNPTQEIKAVGLQMLLDLSDDEFGVLAELDLDSYESIAELSSADISILSERFEIPATRIEQIWISGAQLRLFEGS